MALWQEISQRGSHRPQSSPVIADNFSLQDKATRYLYAPQHTYVNVNEFQWLLVRHSNFIWNAHFFITIYAGAQGSSRSYQFWWQHLHLPLDLELIDLQWFHQALYSLSTSRSYSYVWKNHQSVKYVSRCNLEDWIANSLALVILETAMHPHEQLCGWKTGTLCSFWRPSNNMFGWSLLH